MILAGADLVRSSLLTTAVYEPLAKSLGMRIFEDVQVDLRDRITYRLGEGYEKFRRWIEDYVAGPELPIDHFLSRLFGELLSQPGFGFHNNIQAGVEVGSLVESARKFRQSIGHIVNGEQEAIGQAYVEMVQNGVLAGSYEVEWELSQAAVLVSPAHTFLLSNRHFAHQLWLDVSSTTWYRRIHQPLTNPYVLSKDWNLEYRWSATWDQRFEMERLTQIVFGLLMRCTDSIHLFASELNAYGKEQFGDLLVGLGCAMREFSEENES